MNNNKGFTLTEILLAAMIVGIIGVALAALTTAAVRESGMGRTRAVLRNQVSVALRQLRQDVEQTRVVQVISTSRTLHLAPPQQIAGPDWSSLPSLGIEYTIHCTNNLERAICRQEFGSSGNVTAETVWLRNVKSVQFLLGDTVDGVKDSRLHVRIELEVPGEPVVREVIDETFAAPYGFREDNDA